MKQNGWQFDFTFNAGDWNAVGTKCGEQAKWYGWSQEEQVGTLSVTLEGTGQVTIDFGNCWDAGTVQLYMNDDVISTAPAGSKSVVKTISFAPDSILKLRDEGVNSVISLNSVTFQCDDGKIKNVLLHYRKY